ncbi:MAG: LysR family transcriptional regulator [Acinetobacter sp.]
MLDQLRAMGVFACVVRQNSFSGAARELGITTSAVSQQIRSLEQEMGTTLLYRSTRKISLTETGQVFYLSCKDMLDAAERGKIRINELRDDLIGHLNIATTLELADLHVIPALSTWLLTHRGLSVQFNIDHGFGERKAEPIDITIRTCLYHELKEQQNIVLLSSVEQCVVASPVYLKQNPAILKPSDLYQHCFLPVQLTQTIQLELQHIISEEKAMLKMRSYMPSTHTIVAKALCRSGLGIGCFNYLEIQSELLKGELIEILSDWKLPKYCVYAIVNEQVQSSVKVERCLDILRNYFCQKLGSGYLQAAS